MLFLEEKRKTDTKDSIPNYSLAYLELRLILAKMVYAYDLELIDKDLDWDAQSKIWALWWKPELNVRIKKRPGIQWRAGPEGGEIPL